MAPSGCEQKKKKIKTTSIWQDTKTERLAHPALTPRRKLDRLSCAWLAATILLLLVLLLVTRRVPLG